MGRIIGIDLGTTNTCVAVLENRTPKIIHSRQGGYTIPSVIAKKKDGQLLIGELAKRQAITNPKRTVYGVKRLIGRKAGDPLIRAWNRSVPYQVVPAPNGDAWVRLEGDRDYSPQEISAMIIEEIKATAEDYLNEPVTGAVITVPAYFNDIQRQATKDAGKIAGLEVRRILNEPTAAALAYGVRRTQDQKLAIFDLGGGTFDITILEKTGGVARVLATNGDTFLGGDDFDLRLVKYMLEKFVVAHRHDLSADAFAMQRLKEAAEHAKRELSSSKTTAIHLPFIGSGPKGPLNLELDPVKRELLDQLTSDILTRLEGPCTTALRDAGLAPGDLDNVVLAGGMTRMRAVQAKVAEIFGKKPVKEVNPDEVVAMGAAVQSGILSGEQEEVMLLDVTPHSLGVKVYGDRVSVVIPKNTTIPTAEKKVYSTTLGSTNRVNVDIEIYQGEKEHISDNTYLGRFSLEGLPQTELSQFSVEVTFAIDPDGVVNVSAREKQTGRKASVKITPSSGLSERQVKKIRRARSSNPVTR